jgi:hypothetical protein
MMIFAAGAIGCSDNPAPPEDPVTLSDAWKLFEQGKYGEARKAFADLVPSDGAKAQEGLGWSYLRLENMPSADAAFNSSGGRVDAVVGWTFVKWALEQYGDVITMADTVLNGDPNYSFLHDTTVDFKDLILHQADAHYHFADFTDCIEKIRQLDAGFNADPTDPDIEIILLTKLEALRGTI